MQEACGAGGVSEALLGLLPDVQKTFHRGGGNACLLPIPYPTRSVRLQPRHYCPVLVITGSSI